MSDLDTDVDTLAEAGIINSPDYWRAGDYSAANVRRSSARWPTM